MAGKFTKGLPEAALIVAGFVGVFALTGYLERSRPPLPDGYQDSDLALQGARLKGFAFGAEGLLADWYWMNALQYIGGKISGVGLENLDLDNMSSLNPRLLYPYLNTATDLDPRFTVPYSYGATVLPAIDPQQAITLTEKGIANNPNNWRLYQWLGFIHWRLKDYEKAAEVYQQGARIPDAPPFFQLMAAKMKNEGGSRSVAREIYQEVVDQAGVDQNSRESAQLRLHQLDALDELDLINSALKSFLRDRGRCPTRWSEIIPLLGAAKTPTGRELRMDQVGYFVDPTGVPYRLAQSKCEAQIDWPKSKIPLV
jgi:tetratricopeptide (TPR) repeat protein